MLCCRLVRSHPFHPGATIYNVPALLERERELQELGHALGEARRDRGQFVLVEGSAGLGKTSLLAAILHTAASAGFTCLRARASELERGFSYGCVRQLLEPSIARASSAERDHLFEGAAILAKPLFADSRVESPSPSADSVFSMLHGLHWLLNNIARQGPVALCVDDLHWSDAESLRFLGYLAPRLDGLPLVVLASARTRENVTADLARLFTAPETKVLRLEPLSIGATAALCEIKLGTQVAPDFAVACQGATGGNPFFLETLLREAKDLRFLTEAREAARVRRFGPAAVARAVLLRLAGAPASATALVRAIAVLGDGASVAEAGRLAQIPEDEAARVADLLVTLAILKTGEGLEFAHAIVRQAVYADIGTHERTRTHAQAARILAEHRASDERVATQITEAEPSGEPERVELLRRVAAGALARGAPAAAVAWLRRALAEPPLPESRSQVLLELGVAELRVADPEAADHLVAAVHGIRQPDLLTTAVLHLANALTLRGDADRAVAAIESAIERIESGSRELALILEAELAAKSQQASRAARLKATTRLAKHSSLEGVTPGERLILASLAFEHARASESAREAIHHIERALAAGGLHGEQQPDVVGTFYALVIGLLDTDALDLAARFIEQALADARRRGSIPATAFLIAHRGWFSLRAGAVAAARTTLQDALDRARRCCAHALVERAETELHAAGGRSSDPTAAGISLLTVSERRVAELAARGHSNPEIAQRLFVTRKTIETHLGHIYSKLDISGRAELGRALARDTPTAAG